MFLDVLSNPTLFHAIYRANKMSKAHKLESRISSALLKDNNAITDTPEQHPTAPSTMPNVPAKTTPLPLAKPRSFKIIVLGESGVGKTCLSFRFCAGRFPMNTEATIGLDFREKVRRISTWDSSVMPQLKIVEIDGQRLKLQLWDTAGQERFKRSITHHYYRCVGHSK